MNERQLFIDKYKNLTQTTIDDLNKSLAQIDINMVSELSNTIRWVQDQNEKSTDLISSNQFQSTKLKKELPIMQSGIDKLKKDLEKKEASQKQIEKSIRETKGNTTIHQFNVDLMKSVHKIEKLKNAISTQEREVEKTTKEIQLLQKSSEQHSEQIKQDAKWLKDALFVQEQLLSKNATLPKDALLDKLTTLLVQKNNKIIKHLPIRKEKLDRMVFELTRLLKTKDKKEFERIYEIIMPLITSSAITEDEIRNFKKNMDILIQQFRNETAPEAIQEQLLALLQTNMDKFKTNPTAQLLPTMKSHLSQKTNLPSNKQLAFTAYETNVSELYNDWFAGIKQFDDQLFKIRLLDSGIEYAQESNISVEPTQLEEQYKSLKQNVTEDAASKLNALFDCLNQKQMQHQILNAQDPTSKIVAHIKQIEASISTLTIVLSKELGKIQTKVAQAEQAISTCKSKSQSSLNHLLAAFDDQLRKLNQTELMNIHKALVGDLPVGNSNKMMIQSILESVRDSDSLINCEAVNNAPQVKKVYDKINVMKILINTLNPKDPTSQLQIMAAYNEALLANKETLSARRDNAFMAYLKNSGNVGEKVYRTINDSSLFKPHTKRYFEQVDKEIQKTNVRKSNK